MALAAQSGGGIRVLKGGALRMGARDLAEGVLPSEAIVALWYDYELHEICVQYGYVVISMPVEDYHEFVGLLQQAEEKLEDTQGGARHGR